jgi:hypothetical protein
MLPMTEIQRLSEDEEFRALNLPKEETEVGITRIAPQLPEGIYIP